MLMILKFGFGACVGSFLYCLTQQLLSQNAHYWRRSCCSSCQHPLAWYDLIPICSAIILRCRCRYCREKFSFLYWWVEISIGLLWVICSPIWALIASLLIAMTYCDLKVYWVPDTLQFLLLITCLCHVALSPHNHIMIFHAGIGFILLMGLYQIFSRYIGGADIKLMATLMLTIPLNLLPTFLMNVGLIGLIHYTYLSIKHRDCPYAIPFIPSITLGFTFIQLYQWIVQ